MEIIQKQKNVKGRKGSPIITGRNSVRVKKAVDYLNLNCLDEIDRMNIKGLAASIQAKVAGVTINGFTNKAIGDKINEIGGKVMSYETDLVTTEMKLSENSVSTQFFKDALKVLQLKYVQEPNDDIMEEILKIQMQINKQDALVNNTIDIRNKIRKEVDRQGLDKRRLIANDEIDRPKNAKTVIDMSLL